MYQDVDNLYHQETVVHMIKRECGTLLCRKIERMLGDVWRDGQMLYYSYSPTFRVILLPFSADSSILTSGPASSMQISCSLML